MIKWGAFANGLFLLLLCGIACGECGSGYQLFRDGWCHYVGRVNGGHIRNSVGWKNNSAHLRLTCPAGYQLYADGRCYLSRVSTQQRPQYCSPGYYLQYGWCYPMRTVVFNQNSPSYSKNIPPPTPINFCQLTGPTKLSNDKKLLVEQEFHFDNDYQLPFAGGHRYDVEKTNKENDANYVQFADNVGVRIKKDRKTLATLRPLDFVPNTVLDPQYKSRSFTHIAAYGNEDSSGIHHPKVFALSLSYTNKFPGLTGINDIDRDRLAKTNHQPSVEGTDFIDHQDTVYGTIVFVERPENPFCMIGATTTEATSTQVIKATHGSEYFIPVPRAEGQVRASRQAHPQSYRYRDLFIESATSHINSLIESADQKPCLSAQEIKQQINSLPPGC